MRRKLRLSVVALVVALCSGCLGSGTPPPNLTPRGVTVWKVNDGVVAIGVIQEAAIRLNGVIVCDQILVPVTPPNCHPLVSVADKDLVIDIVADTVTTLNKVPDGWRETAKTAITRLNQRLTDNGRTRLTPYLMALQVILQGT